MGGSGMGELTKFEKHIVLIECNGPKKAKQAASFTQALHKLLKKHGASVKFDQTGAKTKKKK
jgi:hypothetical protein